MSQLTHQRHWSIVTGDEPPPGNRSQDVPAVCFFIEHKDGGSSHRSWRISCGSASTAGEFHEFSSEKTARFPSSSTETPFIATPCFKDHMLYCLEPFINIMNQNDMMLIMLINHAACLTAPYTVNHNPH